MARIDDMVEKHQLNNFVIFKIDDTVESFTKGNCGSTVDQLPMKLPFQNIVLSFNNAFIEFCCSEYVIQHTCHLDISSGNSYRKTPLGEIETCNHSYYRYYCPDTLNYIMGGESSDGGGSTYDLRNSHEGLPEFVEEDRYRFSALIAFLNVLSCKNIIYEMTDPPAKVQKKRAKRGKPPLHSYYTLKIRTNHCSTRAGENEEKAWSNRAHLCRGHIKNYTDDKPLFGKITGKVWCPPHARGNARLGLIHKRYEV